MVNSYRTTQTSTVCASSRSSALHQADVRFLFKVHLRDGPMSSLVVPTIRKAGANTVYVVRHTSVALVISRSSNGLALRLVERPSWANLGSNSLEACLATDSTSVSSKFLLTRKQRTDAEPDTAHHHRAASSQLPEQAPSIGAKCEILDVSLLT